MTRVLLAFEPPDGGVAEQVGQLAAGLGAHGFEVELAGPAHATAYEAAQAAGVPIHRLRWMRGYGKPHRDAMTLTALTRLLRRRRFDLLHAHSAKAGVIGRLAGRATGTATIYSPHCFPFIGEFGAPRRVVATTLERLLGRLAVAIVCVCEDERRVALAVGVAPSDRLHVVLNGCAPCPPGVPPDEALKRFAAGAPTAVAVSVLRAQKSLDVFIDAVPLILERVPGARLALIGDGPLRDELRAQASRLGLDGNERFAFLPFTAPAARALTVADLYVLPSSWEALPIGVLEALACGTPQVATDVGGTGEAVSSETGLLVAPHDARGLAEAIITLLADPGRREAMGAASRRRHAEHFTLGRMVAETARVYESVLADRGARQEPPPVTAA